MLNLQVMTFVVALVGVLAGLWCMGALNAVKRARALADENLARSLEANLGLQLRGVAAEILLAQERNADRVMAAQLDGAERLRSQVFEAVRPTTDAVAVLHRAHENSVATLREEQGARLAELTGSITARQDQLRLQLVEETLKMLAEQSRADRELLQEGLRQAAAQQVASIEVLTRTIGERLDAITGVVHERLDEGFKKTNETFANVMARLATIDEAQKKIDGLTTNVVSLQELLGDKRARGAFGEVQLEALVRDSLPPDAYAFQFVLSSGARADCVLHLPEPTGMVAVDAKFPLENYHRMFEVGAGEPERKAAQSAFRADIKKHVEAIASKYIVAGETSDGAVMFVPAEAVFAEIHAYHPEVVQYAHGRRVWIVSPTTLMAVLNTARAVLKDVETRKQVHLIKDALGRLAKDFARFDERMQKLATHIRQAHDDAQEVHTSSRKISGHFARIESVQIEELPAVLAAGDE